MRLALLVALSMLAASIVASTAAVAEDGPCAGTPQNHCSPPCNDPNNGCVPDFYCPEIGTDPELPITVCQVVRALP